MEIILFPYKVTKHIYLELGAWFKLIIRAWPDGHLGHKLRWLYWRKKVKLKGKGTIGRMVDIVQPQSTSIGTNFICSEYSVINSMDSAGIFIGNNVMLGPRVFIRAANHNFDNFDEDINKQGHAIVNLQHNERDFSIVIEDNVWIGANCIILPGVKIGKGTVIGAGSVVTNNIPPSSVAVGSPARVIRNRE